MLAGRSSKDPRGLPERTSGIRRLFATAISAPVLLVSLALCGCAGSNVAAPAVRAKRASSSGPRFVAASPELIAECHSTARAVAYAVPCPRMVPQGFAATGAIGPGGMDGAAKLWRGWVVGSSYVGADHLVITASPKPLRNYAKVVNGPAWYPKARVKPLAWLSVGGRRVRAVFVPPDTNDGSAFAHHVVLIWTVGQHTYGVGFHEVGGLRRTLKLDVTLLTHIRLVSER
jgi:hypothetical protein